MGKTQKTIVNKAEIDRLVKICSEGNEYEFYEDWNISSYPTLSETRLSKDEVKAFYRDEIEKMIPPEYRDKIRYGCKRRLPYHRRFHRPFVIWWLYPGREIWERHRRP